MFQLSFGRFEAVRDPLKPFLSRREVSEKTRWGRRTISQFEEIAWTAVPDYRTTGIRFEVRGRVREGTTYVNKAFYGDLALYNVWVLAKIRRVWRFYRKRHGRWDSKKLTLKTGTDIFGKRQQLSFEAFIQEIGKNNHEDSTENPVYAGENPVYPGSQQQGLLDRTTKRGSHKPGDQSLLCGG